MSKVKCRETHGGKFTRPKRLWTGRRRGVRRAPGAAQMNAATSAMFQGQRSKFASIAGHRLGALRANRKQGDLSNHI